MADCVPDTRYLASPEFIKTTLHYFTIVEIPVLTFGAYCILFKTPIQMKSVKWLMLNLHFWSALSDLVLSFFGIPFILLPTPAGFGLGFVDAPGFLIYCLVTLLAALTASVMAIYENRYFSLFGKNTLWKNLRKPFLTTIFSLVPVCFLPPYFDVPEQESARNQVYQMLPCLPNYDTGDRQLYVIALSYKVPVCCIAVGMVVLSSSIITFFLLTFYKMWGRRCALSNLSVRTLKMQKVFAVSLTIQSVFMLSVILAPVLVLMWIIVYWHHDQALNNFVFITFSLHGVGSTVMMILIYKPYRDFAFSRICGISNGKKGDTPLNNYPRDVLPSVIL